MITATISANFSQQNKIKMHTSNSNKKKKKKKGENTIKQNISRLRLRIKWSLQERDGRREWKWRLLTDSGVAVVVVVDSIQGGGPVLKELLLGGKGEGRGGKLVCKGPQGGSERAWEMEGGGEGCCSTALCSRQALSGHTITQVGRTSNNKNNPKAGVGVGAILPAEPSRTWTRRVFPDTKDKDFKSCNVTVISTLIAEGWSSLRSFPATTHHRLT